MTDLFSTPDRPGPDARPYPASRFEFRIFGRDLGRERERLASLGVPLDVDHREDVYLIAKGRPDVGLKLRETILDLKLLQRVVGRMELWSPVAQAELPQSGAEIAERFLGHLCLSDRLRDGDLYDRAALLAALAPVEGARAVPVCKWRRRYALGQDLGEITELRIGGDAPEWTCALEGGDPERLAALVGQCGWSGRSNVSYPRHLHDRFFARGQVS